MSNDDFDLTRADNDEAQELMDRTASYSDESFETDVAATMTLHFGLDAFDEFDDPC